MQVGLGVGYDTVPVNPNENAKKYVINKEESEIVKKIFDDYASGVKVKEIKKWIDDNGIKSRKGRPLHENTIMHILKSPKYIGTLTLGGESRENVIPAIIDKDVFERVQMRTERNKRNPSTFKAVEHYLLSTKTICGHCKAPVVADSGTSGTKGIIYRYYKCYSRKKLRTPCDKKQVSKSMLEDLVVKHTHALLHNVGAIETIAEQLVAYNNEMQTNPKLELYEKELRETEKSIANLLRAVEQGLYNQSTQDRMLQLESDRADLLYRIDGEKINLPVKLNKYEVMFYLDKFRTGDINDQRFCERLIDIFVNKVILWNERIIITYNIKGSDGEKISTEQILQDFEERKSNIIRFDSQQYGGGYGD